jgi:hypothetical protein
MGITIHYEGKLSTPGGYDRVTDIAMKFAEEHRFPFLLFGINPDPPGQALRSPQGWPCPIQGIYIQPDPACDPLILEFDQELQMRKCCNTQLADISVHILVIDLLRKLQHLFESFQVRDDGKYWETRDIVLLQQKRESYFRRSAGRK